MRHRLRSASNRSCLAGLPALPLVLALALALALAAPAEAGEPIPSAYAHHPQPFHPHLHPHPYPIPTAAYRPQALGTFRASPMLYVSTGYTSGGAYAPAGQYQDAASMAVFGPTSVLRAVPRDVVVYGRGYDGRLYPTAVGTSMTYPALSPYNTPELQVNPVRHRINYALPSVDPPWRERLGPFPLGEY